jgi:hypothetical protein
MEKEDTSFFKASISLVYKIKRIRSVYENNFLLLVVDHEQQNLD